MGVCLSIIISITYLVLIYKISNEESLEFMKEEQGSCYKFMTGNLFLYGYIVLF